MFSFLDRGYDNNPGVSTKEGKQKRERERERERERGRERERKGESDIRESRAQKELTFPALFFSPRPPPP